MHSQFNSQQLFARWQNGEQAAADAIFNRYVERLVALARSRMAPHLRAREGEEDVVQSVYRSFFVRAREGQFVLERSGDLWRLLATITVNKVRKKAEFHGAAKRNARIERHDAAGDDEASRLLAHMAGSEPAPDDVVSVAEELGRVMGSLPAHHRQMLELRLQGDSVEEIAQQVERSEHQVRRVLNNVHQELEARLLETSDSSSQK